MAESASRARHLARQRVLQATYQLLLNPGEPRALIEQFRAVQDFGGVDEAYFVALVKQIEATRDELEAALAPYLDRPIDSLDPTERAVLRIGACELCYHPEVPARVVLDEAVELARRFGAESGHAFVNAVLDRLARERRAGELGD